MSCELCSASTTWNGMSVTFGISCWPHRVQRHPTVEIDPEVESRRDSAPKPRVARHELPWVRAACGVSTPKELRPFGGRPGSLSQYPTSVPKGTTSSRL